MANVLSGIEVSPGLIFCFSINKAESGSGLNADACSKSMVESGGTMWNTPPRKQQIKRPEKRILGMRVEE